MLSLEAASWNLNFLSKFSLENNGRDREDENREREEELERFKLHFEAKTSAHSLPAECFALFLHLKIQMMPHAITSQRVGELLSR